MTLPEKMIKTMMEVGLAQAVPAVAVVVEEAHAEAVVEEDAVVAEVNRKIKAMKKIIIHSIPVLISLIWLVFTHHTFNPISLKGPSFLSFAYYRILCFNFYFKINKTKNIRSHILLHDFYFHFGNYKTGKRYISRETSRFFNNDFSCGINCDTFYSLVYIEL